MTSVISDVKLDFDDVLIRPQRSVLESRKDVSLEREFYFYHSPRIWKGVPIVCSNMVPIATKAMAIELTKQKMVTCLHKYYTLNELVDIFNDAQIDNNYAWVSIGKNQEDLAKILKLTDKIGYEPNIVIDVPNGYLQSFVEFCSNVREKFKQSIICAGNVCTSEMVQELIIHGKVDICKIQIGPGKMCQTRMMTGVGYGTISCIQECSMVAHGLKSQERHLALVMSDGGCKYPGDICKSFCAGSDFTMIGSLLSATDKCEGDWGFDNEGKRISLRFYGMSSHYAQEKHGNGKNNYRASEGAIKDISYKGTTASVIQEILGGIRSCCTYIGSKSIRDMGKCGQFIKVNKIHDSYYEGAKL